MRDRLIELINEAEYESLKYEMANKIYPFDDYKSRSEFVANHLLANGVIVPPYRNETTIYFVESDISCIWEGRIASWSVQKDGLWFYAIYICGLNYWHEEQDIGKTVFLTREEAEKALKERSDTE